MKGQSLEVSGGSEDNMSGVIVKMGSSRGKKVRKTRKQWAGLALNVHSGLCFGFWFVLGFVLPLNTSIFPCKSGRYFPFICVQIFSFSIFLHSNTAHTLIITASY